MKNLLYLLGICLVACITFISCDKKDELKQQQKEVNDITKLVMDNVENPIFIESEDFINYIIEQKERRRCEAILSRLSLSEINEMSKVIIQRDGYVDWKKFLKEYDTSYQRVYRYLEEPDTSVPKTEVDTLVKVKKNNENVLTVTKKSTNGTENVNSNVQRE